jgi:hypothetical protein
MSEQSRAERKDRLFLALDEDHPSQIGTVGRLPVERNGIRLPAMARVLDEEKTGTGYPTGRFMLRKNAPDYEEQLAALREMCENGPVRLQEIDLTDPKATHQPEWAKAQKKLTDREELIELQRKADERSDLEVLTKQLKAENDEYAATIDSKDAEIAKLRARLAEVDRKKG